MVFKKQKAVHIFAKERKKTCPGISAEKVSPVTQDRSEKRIISLIGYARQDVMGIHIENYCEDELEFRNGLPVSTKGDDNYHGFGMKSIQYVVEKYGGNLVANLEEKIFSVDIIFPVLD